MEPITVLISCYNRPLYLWSCLDALYRTTRYPHEFVLLDMASRDPLVADIIAGFSRRAMFSEVICASKNSPEDLIGSIEPFLAGPGDFLAYVEGDVLVEESDPCWLGKLAAIMIANPELAMLGSRIDQRDFVDLDRARAIAPEVEESILAGLIKLFSPERTQDLSGTADEVAYPHNPPGRLLLLRKAAVKSVGLATDGALDAKLRAAGFETGVAKTVRHRHLSLLHIFDYPDYDVSKRNQFMKELDDSQRRNG